MCVYTRIVYSGLSAMRSRKKSWMKQDSFHFDNENEAGCTHKQKSIVIKIVAHGVLPWNCAFHYQI